MFELGGETDDDARMMSILFTYKQWRKLGFLQEGRNSNDICFLYSPEVLSCSQSHTPTFCCLCNLFFPIPGIFAHPEITDYSKSLSSSPISTILFCFGNRPITFIKLDCFFFFPCILSGRPFLCSSTAKYNFTCHQWIEVEGH